MKSLGGKCEFKEALQNENVRYRVSEYIIQLAIYLLRSDSTVNLEQKLKLEQQIQHAHKNNIAALEACY